MRRRIAATFLLALLLAGCASRIPDIPDAEQDLSRAGAVLDQQAAADMLAAYRGPGGRLEPDPRLMHLAEQHARRMAEAGRMGHDVGGRGFAQRLADSNYPTLRAYENIGAGQKTLRAAIEAWDESAAHRANMRKRNVSRFGIAAARGSGRYPVYWVLIVAEPNEAQPSSGAYGWGSSLRMFGHFRV